MNKGKVIIYIAALLIVINVALLGFNYLKPQQKKQHKKEGPKNIIIKRLNFDKEQIVKFEAIIPEHRANISKIQKELRKNKQTLYNTLENTEISRDSILNEIGEKQIEIEQVHLKHFEQIQSICKPEQLPAYKDLIKEMGSFFGGPKHKRKH